MSKYCMHGCYSPECGICVPRVSAFSGSESAARSPVPGVLLLVALGALAWKLRSRKKANPIDKESDIMPGLMWGALGAGAVYALTQETGSVSDPTYEESFAAENKAAAPLVATTAAPAPSVEQESLAKSIVGDAKYPERRKIIPSGGMNIDPTFTKGVDTRSSGVRQLTEEEMKQHQYVSSVMKESTPAYYQYASSSFGPPTKTPEVTTFMVGKR